MTYKSTKNRSTKGSKPQYNTLSAVAVDYLAEGIDAPQVSVKGKGLIAREMKAIAKRFGVPIHHSREISEKLSEVEISTEIPKELYEDISRIFLSLQSILKKN